MVSLIRFKEIFSSGILCSHLSENITDSLSSSSHQEQPGVVVWREPPLPTTTKGVPQISPGWTGDWRIPPMSQLGLTLVREVQIGQLSELAKLQSILKWGKTSKQNWQNFKASSNGVPLLQNQNQPRVLRQLCLLYNYVIQEWSHLVREL